MSSARTHGIRIESPSKNMETRSVSSKKAFSQTQTFGRTVKTAIPVIRQRLIQEEKPEITLMPTRVTKEQTIQEVTTLIDNFFSKLHIKTFRNEIEDFIQENITSNNVVYWEEITSLARLYSYKYKVSVNHEDTLIGQSFFNTTVQTIPVAGEHQHWRPELDGKIVNEKGPLIIFQLRDFDGSITGLIEIQKKFADPEPNFRDLTFINILQQKFELFSRFLKQPSLQGHIFEMSSVMAVEQFLAIFSTKMKDIFKCADSEIWDFTNKLKPIQYKNGSIKEINNNELGITGFVLSKGQLYNSFSIKRESCYNVVIDGQQDLPFMGNVCNNLVIIIRGCTIKPIFTSEDEYMLDYITPFVCTYFRNALKYSENPNSEPGLDLLKGIQKFLPVYNVKRSLVGMLEDTMVEIQKISQSDRVVFLKVNEDKLESAYFSGSRKPIKMKIGEGIAGYVAQTGQELNLSNAADSSHFNPSIDEMTGYTTRTLMSTPIINTFGEVHGVIQLINKMDNMPFSKRDSLIATVYGTLCTYMIHNQNLQDQTNDLQKRIDMVSKAVPKLEDVDGSIRELCHVARICTDCMGVTVYLFNNTKGIVELAGQDGHFKPAFSGKGAVDYCLKNNKSLIINDTFHEAIVHDSSDRGKRNILLVPIIADGSQIGCVEACNKHGNFTQIDLNTLTCISNIVSTSVTMRSMMNVIEHGRSQLIISHFINRDEIGKSIVPASFSNKTDINVNEYKAYERTPEELVSTVFEIYHQLNLLGNIKCDDFFTFICSVRSSYNQLGYHSWVKVVSIAQFVYRILSSSHDVFSKVEIISLIIASLLVYSGHDGTDDSYHKRLMTTEAIIAGSRSVHVHLAVTKSMHILSKFKNKLFFEDVDSIMKSIISFIMSQETIATATEELSKVIDSHQFDITCETHRQLFLQCMFNMCLYDEFARSNEISDKWEYLYSLERFSLGTREVEAKLTYSSKHNCQELYNKKQCVLKRMAGLEKLVKVVSAAPVKDVQHIGIVGPSFNRNKQFFQLSG
ncbi:GAF domain containing protein [Trichomonas vaginalis G3]|uniref:GAF domain containing protein n=1 Tax=Trichomonas vaginalis (strain ATCC PRA-98 / G3) TaxID=412133 RepID=A2EE12_TRIV3|nr:oxygen sensor histidine kinase response regulator DevS/DosS family [Trichomonas vaginalis G3]EAY09124.1 GAF domain containing protein [Trichomonas vaginalis G3]KAI5502644.1 oxygen sensor histidine kinase response regulator DevS/DosS family [Trichomonas vaginalis G3]|eukprot:XP_001321347.1 GAF domain containing protein [Trichomonas vaginalis G3]